MKVAIRFRRKAGADARRIDRSSRLLGCDAGLAGPAARSIPACGEVGFDDVADEVACRWGRRGSLWRPCDAYSTPWRTHRLAGCGQQSRASARRTADSTARIEAVMMLACTPTPNSVTREGVVISTNAAARASLPLPIDFSSYESTSNGSASACTSASMDRCRARCSCRAAPPRRCSASAAPPSLPSVRRDQVMAAVLECRPSRCRGTRPRTAARSAPR